MDTAALRPAGSGGIAPERVAHNRRAIAYWLLVLAGLVLAMVVLGGITRLNHAGLSIVDWRPLVGVLPPFGEEAWQALFADYKRFPEYQELNPGMTLAGFKEIFWLEYAHRLLGRIVGIAFALPFIWFLIRRAFDRPLAVKVLAIGVLGGLQGLLGWYMVKSGLVDRPDVSPYRLAAHLGLAVAIYGCLIWVALGLLTGGSVECVRRAGRWRGAIWGATGLVFLTVLSGAFVAGNDAGLAYNTFPLMADAIVPPDIFLIEPLWRNFFENVPLVQLDHRLLATLTALIVILIWAAAMRWLGPAGAGCASRGGGGGACSVRSRNRHLAHLRASAAGCGASGRRNGGVHGDPGRPSPAVSAPGSACFACSCAALRPFMKRLMRRGMKPIRPRTARPSRAF